MLDELAPAILRVLADEPGFESEVRLVNGRLIVEVRPKYPEFIPAEASVFASGSRS